ncbi:hypothetical protein [uncultured Azohydromonas sp.]|uniref:hypothetical protein n=1 Tax=uncultured Azohydromonas sp. TaxID=487342 RepID=UPI0026191A66|nr:hypothetical protein [uncultured Azohydromonas sp.]
MGAYGPLVSFFLFLLFLLFIVMPLDGEEHARAEHENLERKEDYRDPIHHLSISRLLLDTVYREERYLETLLQWLHFPVKAIVNSISILTYSERPHPAQDGFSGRLPSGGKHKCQGRYPRMIAVS